MRLDPRVAGPRLSRGSRKTHLPERGNDHRYLEGMERLIGAVQQLSLARDLDTVMTIVRQTARELTGADGAAFILREGDLCFYADEDAIGPLWKGQRFPMTACISGWSMMNRQTAIIEDIYADPRIPVGAYRPTFVKSLAMVPIRPLDPIGAIGNYWATKHRADPDEIRLLQALADSTSVTLENVGLYTDLERRVRDRTVQLEAMNRELEAFGYSVSHDLRAPLRGIEGFSHALLEDHQDELDAAARDYLRRIHAAARRMAHLMDDLLHLSRVSRAELQQSEVDLSGLARLVASELCAREPHGRVVLSIEEGRSVVGDAGLLRIALENLFSNALKFTRKRPRARIEFGATERDGRLAYFVRDNGAGFDMARYDKLFVPFRRLHDAEEFEGTGIGLATVQRVIQRHGGSVWAESEPDRGAVFYFTLDGP